MAIPRPKQRRSEAALPLGILDPGGSTGRPTWGRPLAGHLLAGLTVEVAVFAGVVAAALLLRANAIGRQPFGAAEGAVAYAAFQLAHFTPPTVWAEPAVATPAAIVFFLAGATDVTARLIPLAAGVGLVGAAWLLRPLVGRPPALVTAALIALSSLLTLSAREVSSAAPAGLAALAGIALAFRLIERPSPAAAYGLAGALAVLLTAGPAGFQTVLVFAVFVTVHLAARQSDGPIRRGLHRLWADRAALVRPAILATALTAVISSGLLLQPAGAGVPAIAAWVRQFDWTGRPASWLLPFGQALAYDPAIVLLGALGVVSLARRMRRTPFENFMLIWAAGNLLMVALAGDRTAHQAVALLLPLAVAGGIFLGGLVERASAALSAQTLLAAVPLAGLAGFAAIFITLVVRPESTGYVGQTWVGVFLRPGGPTVTLWIWASVILGVLGATVGAGAVLAFGRHAVHALVGLGVAILVLSTVHAGARLNYGAAPELVAPPRLSAQGAALAGRIVELTERLQGRPVAVAVAPAFDQPLRWYLRKLPDVAVSAQPRPDATIQVLPEGANLASAPGTYLVEKAVWQLSPPANLPDAAAVFRWWAYGETPQPAGPSAAMYYRFPR